MKHTITTIVLFIFSISLLPISTYADGMDNSHSDIFKRVEQEFKDDITNGVHISMNKYSTDSNHCDYSIGNIAKAFAKMESDIGTHGISIPTNNWNSLHPSSRRDAYVKWDGHSTMTDGETLRVYNSPEDSIYDFMYLFKYFYKCDVSENNIENYIYGYAPKTPEEQAHSRRYYNNLIYFLNQYESTHGLYDINVFNHVEDIFKKDIRRNYRDFPIASDDNKCQYDIAKIAYAFHVVSNPTTKFVNDTNNLYNMTIYTSQVKSYSYTDNGFTLYKTTDKSIYDFMYTFKYKFNCAVTKDNVKQWFYGDSPANDNDVESKYEDITNLLITE